MSATGICNLPLPAPSRQRRLFGAGAAGATGFTLIEMLVVIVILGILATAVSLSLGGSSRSALRYEAERLRLLLELADTEARRSGSPVQWQSTAHGYQFLRAEDARTDDDRFRPRTLPDGLHISLATPEALPSGAPSPAAHAAAYSPLSVLFRPGIAPLFTLQMRDDTRRFWLEGRPDGSVMLTELQAGTS